MTHTQFLAADPNTSVWLAAHAGTGKTKVLTDRVLRLLLCGTPIEHILCLTYTKAAAMEMQARLRKELARWSELADEALHSELAALLGRPAQDDELMLARTLLYTLLDHPTGMAIQTIHAFCQSLITAFPVESGLTYAFEVADEARIAELLECCVQQLYRLDGVAEKQKVADALSALSAMASDKGLGDLVKAVVNDHALFFALLARGGGRQQLIDDIMATLDVSEHTTAETLDAQLTEWIEHHRTLLHPAALMWQQESDKAAIMANALLAVLAAPGDAQALQHMLAAMRTSTGELRAASVFAIKKAPDHSVVLARFYDALCRHQDQQRAVACAHYSAQVVMLADGLLALFVQQKQAAGLLDYDDVIMACIRLLADEENRGWVASRLGYRLHHLLLDEAQDTSPAQWVLLEQLISELFQGGQGSARRSLFVVGDKKQSIYRFQGADPELFSHSEQAYAQWFAQAGLPFARLSLDTSFRSSSAVLEVVDALCGLPQLRGAIGDMASGHRPHRSQDAGRVEMWPLIVAPRAETPPAWQVDAPSYVQPGAIQQLAMQVADTIATWLKDGRVLPSKGRAIRPEDIMILVRSRGALVPALHRQLLRLGVPVAGADRIHLSSHLAVQDMLAVARWCLLSRDDLSLACILKGPLFGVDERHLFDLAHGRGEQSLWQRLCAQDRYAREVAVLEALANMASTSTAYEFFARLLYEHGLYMALHAHLGDEVRDVCGAFLQQVQQLQSQGVHELQQVVLQMESSQQQIKRDMEHGVAAVRIMTVHGAKGLQAPVVILPDTTQRPPTRKHVWWTQYEGRHVCLVVPPYHKAPATVEQIKQQVRAADAQEYQRLLYVAATRAEDELYVMGAISSKKPQVGSWYELMHEAFQAHRAQMQTAETPSDAPWIITSPQLRVVDVQEMTAAWPVLPLPDWVRQKATAVITPDRHLRASHAHDGADSIAMQRGSLVHRLLQWASGDMVADAKIWQARARSWGAALSPDIIVSAADEAMHVRTSPDLAWVFGPHSRAEVAVHYRPSGGAVLRGQIDRLVLSPDSAMPQEVHIVDFKTDRLPPLTTGQMPAVPDVYAQQLVAYRRAMAALYPQAQVRCWLLWTSACMVQQLEDELFKDLPLSLDSGAACA